MSPWKIFLSYFKIGCLAFGGGYAMMPLIEREFVEKHHIIEEATLYELFSLSMSMPGLIAVNMAMFLGHRIHGVKGALMGALGVVLPSIIIITVIASFFRRFTEYEAVQSIFKGLNIAVLALIAEAVWRLMKQGIKDKVTLMIFLGVFVGYLLTGFNPVLFAIGGALVGLFFIGRRERHE